MKLEKKFIEFCSSKKLEINSNQIKIINSLEKFQNDNFDNSFLSSFFKKESKLGFYLHGDVGVGKTMILDFFFKQFEIKKTKVHFNEFMINFHDFMFNNDKKDKAIEIFVNNLRNKAKILFFDEFQVTNIVDAMILGRLFEKIFEKKNMCFIFIKYKD
jgi:cell division protein ZapE